uniref:Reverse transcriptase domain-containing protein n=1 Tax=Anolis carolinensis TaxID=28377 RepID=R4GAZ5_ANOCA
MIWTSKSLEPKVDEIKILTRDLSDHCPLIMNINYKKKPVSWRLDNNLIKQETDIKKIKRMTMEYFQFNDNQETSPQTTWDAYKAVARGHFIQQKARKNRIKYQKLQDIQKEMEAEELQLKKNPSDGKIMKKLKILHKQKSNLELEHLANQLKWTKQNAFENANKPGRWLARMIRKKKNKQQITKIESQGKLIYIDDKIRDIFESFYSNLYKKDNIDLDLIGEYLSKLKLQKITEEQRLTLNKEITENEIKMAIKNLDANKSPGPDGFTAGFYKLQLDEIIQHLKKVMNEALTKKIIPETWKKAEIILIHKEGSDPNKVSNYRPISLLNTDYKIFTKVLANRFTEFLKEWISDDQTGFLPNRSTKNNVRLIIDSIEYFDVNHQKEVGFLAVDAEKAFDNVNWNFFKLLLKEIDIGNQFQNGINAIYHQQSARIRVNNQLTKEFEITKGTRQGCPLSPLIFIFTLEIMLNSIQKDENLKGIKLDKQEIKIRAFADDVICVIENPKEMIKDWLKKIEDFGYLAGFKLNKKKTVILTKNMSMRSQRELKEKSGLEIVKKMKYLGIWIASKNNQLLDLNYGAQWKEIKKDLGNWANLNISLMGRIAVIKMNVLPKLLYLFRNIPIIRGAKVFKDWNKELSKFIWKNKKPRIKFSTMITPQMRGGFGLPDLQLYHEACALEWVIDWVKLENKKLLTIEGFNLRWGWHGYLCYDKMKIDKNFGNHFVRSSLIKIWVKYRRYLYEKTPLCLSSLEANQRRLLGWNNWPTYKEILKKSNLISGIVGIKEIEEVQKKYKNISWFQYHQIKESYNRDKETGFNLDNNFWDNILQKNKKLVTILYNKLIEWNTESAIVKESMLKWSRNIGRPITMDEWENIWNKKIKYCYSIDLKENWLKTIHRWYLTPKKLGLMYRNRDKRCWRCKEQIGSYFHIWWNCKNIKNYWKSIHLECKKMLKINLECKPEYFLLGLLEMQEQDPLDSLKEKENKIKIFTYAVTAARMVVAKNWKNPESPTVTMWLEKLLDIKNMDKLTYLTRRSTGKPMKQTDWSELEIYLQEEMKGK